MLNTESLNLLDDSSAIANAKLPTQRGFGVGRFYTLAVLVCGLLCGNRAAAQEGGYASDGVLAGRFTVSDVDNSDISTKELMDIIRKYDPGPTAGLRRSKGPKNGPKLYRGRPRSIPLADPGVHDQIYTDKTLESFLTGGGKALIGGVLGRKNVGEIARDVPLAGVKKSAIDQAKGLIRDPRYNLVDLKSQRMLKSLLQLEKENRGIFRNEERDQKIDTIKKQLDQRQQDANERLDRFGPYYDRERPLPWDDSDQAVEPPKESKQTKEQEQQQDRENKKEKEKKKEPPKPELPEEPPRILGWPADFEGGGGADCGAAPRPRRKNDEDAELDLGSGPDCGPTPVRGSGGGSGGTLHYTPYDPDQPGCGSVDGPTRPNFSIPSIPLHDGHCGSTGLPIGLNPWPDPWHRY